MFGWRPAFNWLRFLSGEWPFSENVTLLTLAVVLGLATSVGVWLFRAGIDFFQRTFRESLVELFSGVLGPVSIVAVLALGGLIVGFLMDRFIGHERHHGVAGIMEAEAFAGGRLRYQRMPLKAALASFSLGAGASVGPEDPSVQIGANIGSALGQRLHMRDERVRLLVAAGAAGGIAAAFNAPIAGVFFALEVILGDFSTGSFGVVVLTAVIATVALRAIQAGSLVFTNLSPEVMAPELGIASYSLGGLQELPLYIFLGLLLAPVSALVIRMLYWQSDLWQSIKAPAPVRTMLAGAVVGVIAMFLPQIMGTGRDTINALLNQDKGQFIVTFLLALGIAKLVATTVCVGGGFVGGLFAPTLFIGATLGRAYGQFLTDIFPRAFSANPAAFAIAGMAAAMTGVIRAPITAVILLFELTNDYNLILPIMLTATVCLFVVERFAPDGLYHLGLARKGIRLSRIRDVDLMQTMTVGETMITQFRTVPTALPASQLVPEFTEPNMRGAIVLNEAGLLYGIVTLHDLNRALAAGELGTRTVGDICTRNVITVTADTPLPAAAKLIAEHDFGHLPVVESQGSRKVIGLLRRRDIVRAYDVAVQRMLEQRQRSEEVRLSAFSGAHVIEMRVEKSSPAAEHRVKEVHWPASSMIAAVRRRGEVIVPGGDTLLHVGDLLTVVTTPGHEQELEAVFVADHSHAP